MSHFLKTLLVVVLLAGGSTFADPPRAPKAVDPPTDPESGNGLYKSYCASCHGLAGKGDGPAASAMRMKPTDLTQLTNKANGAFPMLRLQKVLGGDVTLPAHGGRRMPVWGPSLTTPGGTDARSLTRMRNLIAYIQSIQHKGK